MGSTRSTAGNGRRTGGAARAPGATVVVASFVLVVMVRELVAATAGGLSEVLWGGALLGPGTRCRRVLPHRPMGVRHPEDVLDDAEGVIAAARAGSAEAFTAIYTDLAGPVAAYLRAKGVSEVEDVTSDVFLAVFTGMGRFVGDEAALRSWVFTIVHRRVIDGWRRGGRRPDVVPYDAERDLRVSRSAEVAALELVGEERALALIGLLTDEQRDVLVLRVVADLTVDDVATVLGSTPGAVKALQRRGLASLRRILSRQGVTL